MRSSKHWNGRAEEARALACDFEEGSSWARQMEQIARDYERMAHYAREREKLGVGEHDASLWAYLHNRRRL